MADPGTPPGSEPAPDAVAPDSAALPEGARNVNLGEVIDELAALAGQQLATLLKEAAFGRVVMRDQHADQAKLAETVRELQGELVRASRGRTGGSPKAGSGRP